MGLGRRTFAPGEVLTASNVMNYLQDQAVMSFAGTAARGSAIGTAVQEGMVSYLQDTNFLQVRDDNAWHSIAGVQAVPSAAVRDALIPTPNQGDAVFRADLGYVERYYGLYNVSTNPGGLSVAGWYRDFGRGQKALLGEAIVNNLSNIPYLGTSYADLGGMSKTVVTSGLPVKITVTVSFRNGASGSSRYAYIKLLRDATQLYEAAYISVYYNTSADIQTATFFYKETPTAGSKVYKIQAAASNGAAVGFVSGNIMIEEIYE